MTVPLVPLSRLLQKLLRINIFVTVVAVVAGVYGWVEYANLSADVDADETFLPSDGVNAFVGLAQFIFLVVLSITFLRWIYRINGNLRQLSGEPMKFTPGWAVGWYFIPIANLWKPYQAMKEIWTVAHRGAVCDGGLLGWWWGLWVISSIVGRMAMRLTLRADDNQSHVVSAALFVVSDAVDVVLNCVALMVVTRIAAAYDAHYSEAPVASPVA